VKSKPLTPRLVGLALSLTLAFPPPALALRTLSPTESVRTLAGLEESLRPGPEGAGIRRLLIVEDSSDWQERLLGLAREWRPDIEVSAAWSLAQAWLRIERERPFDAVITDIGLVDGTGLQLIEQLQRSGRRVPVAVFSRRVQQDELRLRELGVETFAEKPALLEDLEPQVYLSLLDRLDQDARSTPKVPTAAATGIGRPRSARSRPRAKPRVPSRYHLRWAQKLNARVWEMEPGLELILVDLRGRFGASHARVIRPRVRRLAQRVLEHKMASDAPPAWDLDDGRLDLFASEILAALREMLRLADKSSSTLPQLLESLQALERFLLARPSAAWEDIREVFQGALPLLLLASRSPADLRMNLDSVARLTQRRVEWEYSPRDRDRAFWLIWSEGERLVRAKRTPEQASAALEVLYQIGFHPAINHSPFLRGFARLVDLSPVVAQAVEWQRQGRIYRVELDIQERAVREGDYPWWVVNMDTVKPERRALRIRLVPAEPSELSPQPAAGLEEKALTRRQFLRAAAAGAIAGLGAASPAVAQQPGVPEDLPRLRTIDELYLPGGARVLNWFRFSDFGGRGLGISIDPFHRFPVFRAEQLYLAEDLVIAENSLWAGWVPVFDRVVITLNAEAEARWSAPITVRFLDPFGNELGKVERFQVPMERTTLEIPIRLPLSPSGRWRGHGYEGRPSHVLRTRDNSGFHAGAMNTVGDLGQTYAHLEVTSVGAARLIIHQIAFGQSAGLPGLRQNWNRMRIKRILLASGLAAGAIGGAIYLKRWSKRRSRWSSVSGALRKFESPSRGELRREIEQVVRRLQSRQGTDGPDWGDALLGKGVADLAEASPTPEEFRKNLVVLEELLTVLPRAGWTRLFRVPPLRDPAGFSPLEASVPEGLHFLASGMTQEEFRQILDLLARLARRGAGPGHTKFNLFLYELRRAKQKLGEEGFRLMMETGRRLAEQGINFPWERTGALLAKQITLEQFALELKVLAGLEEQAQPEKLTWRAWWATLGSWGPTRRAMEGFNPQTQRILRGEINRLINEEVKDGFDPRLTLVATIPKLLGTLAPERAKALFELGRRLQSKEFFPWELLHSALPALSKADALAEFQSGLQVIEGLADKLKESPTLNWRENWGKITPQDLARLAEEAMRLRRLGLDYTVDFVPERGHVEEHLDWAAYREAMDQHGYAMLNDGAAGDPPHSRSFVVKKYRVDEPQRIRLVPAPDQAGLEERTLPRLPWLAPPTRSTLPSAQQMSRDMRFMVDTREKGNPEVLRFAQWAVLLIRAGAPDIQFAGVATAEELAAAQAQMPDEASRQALDDYIFTYDPADPSSYEAAFFFARAMAFGESPFRQELVLTESDPLYVEWFLGELDRLGIKGLLSPDLWDRIQATLTAA